MRPGNSSEVKDLFNDISSHYDLLNDLFSFGLHRFWKKQLLRTLKPSEGEKWIDFCCGTGDLTISLAKLIKPKGKVIGIDSAINVLSLAKKKASTQSSLSIEWINKDIFDESLGFNSFDGAIMAYGLRNLVDHLRGLEVIEKALKPGGRAGILDFNFVPDSSFKGKFQKMYLRNLVVPIASHFGFHEHYAYLEESLKVFPDGQLQEELAKKAGFVEARHCKIAGGLMGVLVLQK